MRANFGLDTDAIERHGGVSHVGMIMASISSYLDDTLCNQS